MSCCRSRDGRTQWRNADRCRGSRLFEGDNPIIVDPTRGHRMPRKAASIFCSAASSIRPLISNLDFYLRRLIRGGRDFSDDISDHSERRDLTVLIGGRRVTPLKEALTVLADVLAKRPAEEILFDWFRSGRLVGEFSVLIKRRHPEVQAEIDRVYQEHLAKLGKRRRLCGRARLWIVGKQYRAAPAASSLGSEMTRWAIYGFVRRSNKHAVIQPRHQRSAETRG